MAGTMRVPRSRGVLSGTLLVLLGLWGGLVPFVGPYFDFGFSPDDTWVYDTARLQLSVAPGAAAVLGGLIVLFSAHRAFAMVGGWLAALGGAWFVVGGPVATLWDVRGVGAPLGAEEGRRIAEQLAGFGALGVVIVFLAALALGRFAVVGVKETRLVEREQEEESRADERDRADDPDRTVPRAGHGPAEREPVSPARPSGTTQPIDPVVSRYGRDSRSGGSQQGSSGFVRRPDPEPGRERSVMPGDQKVAGHYRQQQAR
ncbi:hypothetical protein [Actinomadura hibisca]|uniref:hypothetical protein n=1 Tax=Actinomadura hibisca TaxID=68565 RepID=UPI000830D118|nr:hypothetical protein [Actinomadura hibisca]